MFSPIELLYGRFVRHERCDPKGNWCPQCERLVIESKLLPEICQRGRSDFA